MNALVAWLRAARDMRATWPHARWVVHLMPWHWRLIPLGYWSHYPSSRDDDEQDDRDGSLNASIQWLWLELSVQSNWPMFGVMPVWRAYRDAGR